MQNGFTETELILFIILALWIIPWKGYALWRAARLEQKWWFIALLVINTAAILEILYIFLIAPRAEKRLQQATSQTKMQE